MRRIVQGAKVDIFGTEIFKLLFVKKDKMVQKRDFLKIINL